jgi:energy-coupling factor transporter transmembrane protein EcfT
MFGKCHYEPLKYSKRLEKCFHELNNDSSIYSYFISIVIFINDNYEKFKNKVLTKLEVLEFILAILITFFFTIDFVLKKNEKKKLMKIFGFIFVITVIIFVTLLFCISLKNKWNENGRKFDTKIESNKSYLEFSCECFNFTTSPHHHHQTSLLSPTEEALAFIESVSK